MTATGTGRTGLAQLLREGSADQHRAAESSTFMADLLAGRVGARAYADYLARLQRVHVALEEVGRSLVGHPAVDAVRDVALERSASLRADVDHWGPGHGATPATDAYVARVHAARTRPARYVAHHYTRYLGDLSGGLLVGRALRRTLAPTGEGLALYAFPDVPRAGAYKQAYRARLDALALSVEDTRDVLEETRTAFVLNRALLAELATVPPASAG